MSTPEVLTYCVRCGDYGGEHGHEGESSTAVLVDLDSTLANTEHRHGAAPMANPSNTWEDYAALAGDDPLIEGVAELVSSLYVIHQVHIVSGRGAVAYPLTLKWLADYDIDFDYFRLQYEHERDVSNEQFKLAYAQRLRARGVTPVLAIDDWPGVHHLLSANGIPTVVVNPMYNDQVMRNYAAAYDSPNLGVLP